MPESSLVYINAYSKILVIDSSQDKIVDSIKFDFPIWGLNLSLDRKILYIQKGYDYHCYPNCPDSVVEVDVNSKKIRYQGENSSLYPTPDGKFIVSSRKGLRIFSTFNHQVVFNNNLEVTTRPTFDTREPVFYAGTADNRILVFDYRSMQIVRYLNAPTDKKIPKIYDLLYSELDNNLYFSTFIGLIETSYTSYLGSIDIRRDQIITTERLDLFSAWGYWGEGYLYSSVATKKVFLLSNYYGAVFECIPFNFFGFSITSQKIVSELELGDTFWGVQILDSGLKAYVLSAGFGWCGPNGILIIDLVQNKIIGTIPVPYDGISLSHARF